MMKLKQNKGWTLIEVLMAIIVFSIAVFPLAKMFGDTLIALQHFSDISVATQLAQELMEEIKSKKWDENEPADGSPTPPPPSPPGMTQIGIDGGTQGFLGINFGVNEDTQQITFDPAAHGKTNWDDIDDYNGLSEHPPLNTDNAIMPGYEKFTRRVEVIYVDIPGWGVNENVGNANTGNGMGTGAPNAPSDFKRIIVTVNWDGNKGAPVRLITIRANYQRYIHWGH